MIEKGYTIEPIGVIRSPLTNPEDAPKQGDEGGYEAWLEIKPPVEPGLDGIRVGDKLIILTWLHLAHRGVLQVHPRNNPDLPLRGVFATRSQDRPNPIGLHEVTVLEVDGLRLKVAPLEAVDGTPIVDIKSVLAQVNER